MKLRKITLPDGTKKLEVIRDVNLESLPRRKIDNNITALTQDILTQTEQIHMPYNENISTLCHISKNLYNQAQYDMRQVYFHNIKPENIHSKLKFPTYSDLAYKFKTNENYKSLYRQTSQWTLKKVINDWDSYWEGIKSYKISPSKFTGKPRIPGYKKKDGEFMLIFTNQLCAINSYTNFIKDRGENNKYLKQVKEKYGNIKEDETYLLFPDKSGIKPIKTRLNVNTDLREVRIIPQGVGYTCEIVYNKKKERLNLDKSKVVGIDLGVDNIVAMANNIGIRPIVVKGSIVKSINQWYNKRRAELYAVYDRQPVACNVKTGKMISNRDTKKLRITTEYRNRLIKDAMHKLSRYIIDWCIKHNIGTIVIGISPFWKQNTKLGKRNNQNFVSIPYDKLKKQLRYKGQEIGMNIIENNEHHTSKCSFFDNEPICHHERYVGKRVFRGLFRSAKGIIVNADVHAAMNIIRNVCPKFDVHDITEGVAVSGLVPESLSVSSMMS